MKQVITFCFLLLAFRGVAQESLIASDTTQLYTSLESAAKNPEKVYKLKLQRSDLREFPKEILKMTNLRELDLSKNKIKEIPEEIGTLKNLVYFNMSKNRLVSVPKGIGQLTNLRTLILNQNEIDSLPDEIGNLTELRYLDLWANNLGYYPHSMRKLIHLEEMDLRNIQLNKKEQDYISSLLPKTNIHFSPACGCK